MIAHVALALIIPSPWWVPDLTLAGLVIAVGASPARWLLCAVAAGFFTMVWAVSSPWTAVAGRLAVGWIIQAAARRWDAADARVQGVVVILASVATGIGALWLHDLWLLPLAALTSLHVATTYLAFLCTRRLWVQGSRFKVQGGPSTVR